MEEIGREIIAIQLEDQFEIIKEWEYWDEKEKVMGLRVNKKLVDKYWDSRNTKPVKEEYVNFKDVKVDKSII
jgi:hypothetical protein